MEVVGKEKFFLCLLRVYQWGRQIKFTKDILIEKNT